MSSLADQLFDASLVQASAEDRFITEAERIVGDHDWWQDLSYDYYDRSFEFHGVTVGQDLTDEQLSAFGDLGFVRCWLNYTDGTERHYGCKPPGRGEIRPGSNRADSVQAIERIVDRLDPEHRSTIRARRAVQVCREILRGDP